GCGYVSQYTLPSHSLRPAPRDQRIDTPRPGTRKHEVEEDKAVERGGRTPVSRRPERQWKTHLKIGDGHFTGEHKGDRSRQETERERATEKHFQSSGNIELPH